jgi:antitoxin component YwqK of YwqJK toxin-antitoxin module
MRRLAHLLACFGVLGIPACLQRYAGPDAPLGEVVRETRRSTRADGSLSSEVELRVRPDGRSERDGAEREFHPDGRLAAERFFARDRPTGLWRTWFVDGTLRSEVDFGPPGDTELRTSRHWHANGALAAEGATKGGIRQGPWTFRLESGGLLWVGAYRDGRRDGSWVIHHSDGRKEAEGTYLRGQRVGSWTFWDEQGRLHVRSAEVPLDGGLPSAGLFQPER